MKTSVWLVINHLVDIFLLSKQGLRKLPTPGQTPKITPLLVQVSYSPFNRSHSNMTSTQNQYFLPPHVNSFLQRQQKWPFQTPPPTSTFFDPKSVNVCPTFFVKEYRFTPFFSRASNARISKTLWVARGQTPPKYDGAPIP